MKKYILGELIITSIKSEIYVDNRGYNREKHTIKIMNKNTKKYSTFKFYTSVIEYINRDRLLKDALFCIYNDYVDFIYCGTIENFIREYGYQYEEGVKTYKLLEKNYNKFKKLVNDNLLELLENTYMDY